MRYAVLSDIHANQPALQAVLDDLGDLPILFLGDAVGYYPYSCAVIKTLLSLKTSGQLKIWLKGNHDAAVQPTPPLELVVNPLAGATLRRTREDLGKDLSLILGALEEGPLSVPGATEICAVHGGPDDALFHYLENTSDAADAAIASPLRVCLVGHTHVPAKLYSDTPLDRNSWRRVALDQAKEDVCEYGEAMVFLNPGSVGHPRDGFVLPDAQFHAAYGILDTIAQRFTVRRVPYAGDELVAKTRSWLQGRLPDTDIERMLANLRQSL